MQGRGSCTDEGVDGVGKRALLKGASRDVGRPRLKLSGERGVVEVATVKVSAAGSRELGWRCESKDELKEEVADGDDD